MHLTNHIQTIKGQELKCAFLLSFHTSFPRLSTSDFFSCPYERSHTLFHLRVRAAFWNPWKVETSVREREKKKRRRRWQHFKIFPFNVSCEEKCTTWACGPVLLVIFSSKVTSCRLHCFLTVPCVSGLSAAATTVGKKIHLLYFFSLRHIYVRIC